MTSCSVGPSYKPPLVEVPSDWKNTKDNKEPQYERDENGDLVYLDHWWEVFEDKKLEELEKLALENNKDLFVAFERIQEARALAGIAAADLYPQITLNPYFSNTNELVKNYTSPAASTAATTATKHGKGAQTNGTAAALANAVSANNAFRAHEMLYFLPINLSYEVDLWGKIRDLYYSRVYIWHAQQKDYEVGMLSLTSNVAIGYYQIRALDAQLELLSKVMQTRQKALDINRDRYEEQIVNYSDVTLAAEELDMVISQYQEASRQRDILEDQIAVLIGVPSSEFSLEPSPIEGLPPSIPPGIPSEVLLRRPDIAEAEYNVRAEHELIKQAYSQFYPSLILNATVGFQSPTLKDFLKGISRYWMDSTQINQIAFDGGRTYYNLRLQIARFKEASGNYQQQILLAFQEVENALANLDAYAKQYENARAITEWAQKTYQLYSDRYTMGVTYYIDVANTERDLLNYQININVLQGYRYIATIQLIRALGGGW